MKNLLIGEVAKRANVTTSTIRYYETIGLLLPPIRKSGRRRYNHSVINKLKLIRAAKSVGWSLNEIKTILAKAKEQSSLSRHWKAKAPQKIQELELIIENTQRMKEKLEASLSCNCLGVEDCILLDE